MPVIFDIPVTAVRTLNLKFKTEVDSEYTAHEQRSSLWTNPRHILSVSVHRNPTNYTNLISFFKARRGRWQAFYFVWAAEHGGDDTQYLVRFNSDDLEIGNDGNYFTFQIVQVMTSE